MSVGTDGTVDNQVTVDPHDGVAVRSPGQPLLGAHQTAASRHVLHHKVHIAGQRVLGKALKQGAGELVHRTAGTIGDDAGNIGGGIIRCGGVLSGGVLARRLFAGAAAGR